VVVVVMSVPSRWGVCRIDLERGDECVGESVEAVVDVDGESEPAAGLETDETVQRRAQDMRCV
jgi:hypothetical protein